VAFAIADDDEGIETHMFATHDDFGDLVDINNAIVEVIFFATESATATTSLAWTATVVAEFAGAWTVARAATGWFTFWVASRITLRLWSIVSGFLSHNFFIFFSHSFSP
jgi:hypothetical protein